MTPLRGSEVLVLGPSVTKTIFATYKVTFKSEAQCSGGFTVRCSSNVLCNPKVLLY